MLTDTVAAPNVCFVQIDLVVKTVIDRDVCASCSIDAGHYFDKTRTVAAVAFANIQNEQVRMNHFVLELTKHSLFRLFNTHALMRQQHLQAMFRLNCVAIAISAVAHSVGL